MFELIKDFSKYKRVMQVFLGIGLIALTASFLVDNASISGLMLGFGCSLTLVAGINILVMYIKQKKDQDYESDMNLEFGDERLRLNKLKVLAYSGIVGMMTLAFSNVFNLLFDTDLLISNMIVIVIYVLTLVGLKLYYRNK